MNSKTGWSFIVKLPATQVKNDNRQYTNRLYIQIRFLIKLPKSKSKLIIFLFKKGFWKKNY